ncbi:MAG TPA: hypothetical protein VHA33_30610 [Candidatus Angelobacter sp.]|jgi:hypothetical protein|nr:hypothetical protein [Candidatus Angelobacter sp.]
MAERPIFIPAPDSPELVRELSMQIRWNPGFAPIQKKKNIIALHSASAKAGYAPLLEVSTKSEEKLGRHLSAFNLKVHNDHLGSLPLEAAFQGSKVFERGGPYTDLYTVRDVRDAKRDPRLKESGQLKGFKFESLWFPLQPKTAFYDWLYITALYEHREWLRAHIFRYAGFTDIEFNPERSINCQARSCALLVTLMKNEWLDEAVSSPEAFINLLLSQHYRPDHTRRANQEALSHH